MKLIAGSVALALLWPASGWAEEGDWSLKLEAGSEYDSNVHRVEVAGQGGADVVDAPVARFGGRFRFKTRPGKGQRFKLDGYAGAKLFASDSSQSENVGVVSLDGRFDRAFETRRAVLGVVGQYYDAIPWQPFGDTMGAPTRNFSTAMAAADLAIAGPGEHRVRGRVGYRTFNYKPDPDYDWAGEQYGLTYQTTIWRGDEEDVEAASFDLNIGYGLGRRRYHGRAFTNACAEESPTEPDCFVPTDIERIDLAHSAHGELVYTGDRIYSARYVVRVNDSNSFGQSLVRQRLELGLTTELFWKVYLTATGAVMLNIFLDPLLLAPDVNSQSFVSIEDENRNSLLLHLSRELGGGWAAEARYAIYSNEFATEELSFRRQTAYLGAVYQYD